MRTRAQSVVEYLSTYSWAVFAAAAVIGVFYALGVFQTPIPIQSCILVPGYLCSHPLLSTTGVLQFNLSYVGTEPITVTGVGCSSTSVPPASLQSTSFVLTSNRAHQIDVSCPVASNSFGSSFNGNLWLQYNTPTQSGLESNIGIVQGAINTHLSTSVTFTTGATSPSSTVMTIDGTQYAASQESFTFDIQSTHTYSFASTISGPQNTQYQFVSASGCGTSGQSGSITVPSGGCTVTALYTTWYYLTVSETPSGGGTVSPADGWIESGTQVPISETAGLNYQFTGWSGTGSGSYGGTSPSWTITMSGPITETADYNPPATLTYTAGLSSPSSTVMTIDGTPYTSASESFTYTAGSQHTYSFATIVSGPSGTQYVFLSASGCGASAQSGTITVPPGGCTLAAAYSTQYYLTTSTSPSDGGSASPASGWYYSGMSVPLTEAPGTNYQFAGWSGTGSGSYSGALQSPSIILSSPVTEVANYNALVTLSAGSISPASTVMTVDGQQYSAATEPFYYAVGSQHTYSFATIVSGPSGTQYVFSSASGCGVSSQSGTITIPDGGCTLSAAYVTQYYLTTAATPSAGGGISPASGWYNSGALATISETPGTNYQFAGWSGTGSGSYSGTSPSWTITIYGPITETANYNAPATVTYYAGLSGPTSTVMTIDGTPYTATSESFVYAPGSPHSYSFASTVSGSSGVQYTFTSVSGCGASAQSGTLNTPAGGCTITAVYTTQNPTCGNFASSITYSSSVQLTCPVTTTSNTTVNPGVTLNECTNYIEVDGTLTNYGTITDTCSGGSGGSGGTSSSGTGNPGSAGGSGTIKTSHYLGLRLAAGAGGSGGGSGGGDSGAAGTGAGTGAGGNGGNGGGIVELYAGSLNNQGTITASGTNGANGARGMNGQFSGNSYWGIYDWGGGGGGGGGGEGGNGGTVLIGYTTLINLGTVQYAVGASGTPGSGGSATYNGANGGGSGGSSGGGGGGEGSYDSTVGNGLNVGTGSSGGNGGAATGSAGSLSCSTNYYGTTTCSVIGNGGSGSGAGGFGGYCDYTPDEYTPGCEGVAPPNPGASGAGPTAGSVITSAWSHP